MSGILVHMIMACVFGPMNSIYLHYFLSGASHWYVRSDIKLPLYPYINMIDTHTQNTHAKLILTYAYSVNKLRQNGTFLQFTSPPPSFTLLPHHISLHTPSPQLDSFVESAGMPT